MSVQDAVSQSRSAGGAGRLSVGSWILFDCATQPFFSLILTFVFPAYFAQRIVGDAVAGQALWGYATGAAGVVLALGAPVLGAVADATGARKPWILVFSLPLVAGASMLWFAAPGAPFAVGIALVGYFLGILGAEFTTVFNNAMMPGLVAPDRLGRLSGTGWAAGYFTGVIVVLAVFCLIVAAPSNGLTLLGMPPLFGLDPAAFEGDRLTGPLSAVWYVVFVLPLFLFVPERASRRTPPLGRAVAEGLGRIRATIANLPSTPSAARFLIAQMLYSDGLVALFALGTIYGAGQFAWGDTQLGIFGISLSLFGAIGAFAGGPLDDRLGSKTVAAGCLVVLIVVSIGLVSIGRDHIGFVFPVAPPQPGAPLFSSTPERLFMACALVVGLSVGPLQSSSRTLLARISPPEHLTAYFGLYALTGKLTSFVAPIMIAVLTDLFVSQQAGFAVIPAFFVAGLALLWGVHEPRPGLANRG